MMMLQWSIILLIKYHQRCQMQAQKRIKTQAYQIWDISDKKQRKQKLQKPANMTRPHKQSEAHLKSMSKDVNLPIKKITPKKHSITVQRSKYKEGNSNKKIYKSKQLTSVCSYSAMEKQSIPATKRKGSNARSVNGNIKKKYSKNKQQINQSLKSTVSNFSVLTKCLTQFIKQQKKKGKDPSMQILHLIKAFNKSQVAPLSKQLEVLINNMLDYIEGTVGFPQEDQQEGTRNQKIMKSRSSFSSASDRQIVYSQILQNSHIPTTIKKQKQNNVSTNDLKPNSKSLFNNSKNRRTNQSNFSEESSEQDVENGLNHQNAEQNPRFERSVSKINRELEQELKHDLQNMHEQLYQLKNAGEKLQVRIDSRGEDRKKLEEIYKKNKQLIESISQKNSEVLRQKKNTAQQNRDEESQEDQY